jgi:carbonic anhydrase/acetyltransferase-like protein (isoleucine patch superfamily)
MEVTSMIIKHEGKIPRIHPSAYVAPNAIVSGDVEIGKEARILFGAVVAAEGSPIQIGEMSVIAENAVVKSEHSEDEDYSLNIGSHVFIGPHCDVIGCKIDDCNYIAASVVILWGARIKSGSAVGIGALVFARTVIPGDGAFVPPHCIAIGDPFKIYSPGDPEIIEEIKKFNLTSTVYRVTASGEDRKKRYFETLETYTKLRESHMRDNILY